MGLTKSGSLESDSGAQGRVCQPGRWQSGADNSNRKMGRPGSGSPVHIFRSLRKDLSWRRGGPLAVLAQPAAVGSDRGRVWDRLDDLRLVIVAHLVDWPTGFHLKDKAQVKADHCNGTLYLVRYVMEWHNFSLSLKTINHNFSLSTEPKLINKTTR